MHRNNSLPPFEAAPPVPLRIQDLVKRMTAKKKTDRVPSAEVLLAELNVILNEI